jgi:hypothetical protein
MRTMPEPTTSVVLIGTDCSERIFGCLTNMRDLEASHDTGGTGKLQNALRSTAGFERTYRIAQYFRDLISRL